MNLSISEQIFDPNESSAQKRKDHQQVNWNIMGPRATEMKHIKSPD